MCVQCVWDLERTSDSVTVCVESVCERLNVCLKSVCWTLVQASDVSLCVVCV